MEEGRAEGQVAVAGGGGEEGFALPEGDEQQIEHQAATGGQEREPLGELLLQLTAAATEQGAGAEVEAEAAVLPTDAMAA